jgi:hypothetical protein
MRMSDYLTGSDREFINLAAVTVTLADGSSEESPFVMIARKSIRMIKPGQRSDDEPIADLAAWQPTPAAGNPIIPRGAVPPPEAGLTAPAEPDKPERPKSGIYPPSEPARHLNRPPSGIQEVPPELRDDKNKS